MWKRERECDRRCGVSAETSLIIKSTYNSNLWHSNSNKRAIYEQA